MARPDVVVIGGGVVGTAAAYFLGGEGANVVLLEREGLAAGSSGHGPGFFNTFGGDFLPGPHLDLAIESVRIIHELRDPLNEFADTDWFNDKPDLTTAFDEAGVQRLQEMYASSRQQLEAGGEKREWISGEDVRKREPLIGEGVLGGYYADSVLQIDGFKLAGLFAAAARKQGTTITHGTATGLTFDGDRATGVQLADGGTIACDAVVVAMGVWTPHASMWTGFPLPICSLKGQLHVLRIPGYTLKHHVIDRVVIMQYPDGLFLLGATPDPAPIGGLRSPEGYIRPLTDTDPIPDDTDFLMRVGRQRFPFIENAEIVKDLSGVRPMSADLLPMIGPLPVYENVHLASGHGRKGIHLSPGTGRLVADLVTRGESDLVADVEAFSPRRFTPTLL